MSGLRDWSKIAEVAAKTRELGLSEVYPILRQFSVRNKLVSDGWDRVLL